MNVKWHWLVSQFLVVVKGILLVLGLWHPCQILPSNRQNDVPNIKVLRWAHLPACSQYDFVSCPAEILWVVSVEVL